MPYSAFLSKGILNCGQSSHTSLYISREAGRHDLPLSFLSNLFGQLLFTNLNVILIRSWSYGFYLTVDLCRRTTISTRIGCYRFLAILRELPSHVTLGVRNACAQMRLHMLCIGIVRGLFPCAF